MKKGLLTLAVAFASMLSVSAKSGADDSVILTIDGQKTYLSEFEYLYNKNNQQQQVRQSPEEYLDLFLIYKLKVADAVKAGVDTTKSFREEYEKYRIDLALPYMVDRELQESILQDAYLRQTEDVNVSHIMLAHSNNPTEDAANKQLLDSLRTEIVNGKLDFDEVAVRYSVDPAAKRTNGGNMGFISGNGMYPEPFETAAYSTKVGEISPVIDSGFGYHIVLVKERRPAKGQVLVEHILKLTQGKTPEQAEAQKAAIDSIYNVLIAGADFNEVAKLESEDPGSASRGGKLDWFGSGRMVKPFEDAAFAAEDGEITKPFATSYGYHIIHRLDHKDVQSFEEMKPMLQRMIDNDERSLRPRQAKIEQLLKVYDPKMIQERLDEIAKDVEVNGGYDSTIIAKYIGDTRTLGKFNTGDVVTIAEVISTMPRIAKVNAKEASTAIQLQYNKVIEQKAMQIGIDRLPLENAEYRNLLNEYHDGFLLFDISNTKVWGRASNDRQGLEAYFKANKDKYSWESPKFKGYIIFASSDSVRSEALGFLAENVISTDTIVKTMRKQFGKDVRVEKVIAAKGDNPIVDYIAFGGEKPENNGRWVAYFPYSYKVIEQPEEAADVRGAVVADYQSYLEEEWIKDLKKNHKYKVNRSALKQLK